MSARTPGEPGTMAAPVFLTAEWRNLAVANFEVSPKLLQPFVPTGTELDFWNNRTYISLVGFRFLKTKVWGIGFPFHRNFEEVNLRFYVRRKVGNEWRRGVVFIQEIVPRFVIAWAAKTFYNENYVALPMAHRIENETSERRRVEYLWKSAANECRFAVTAQTEHRSLAAGSEAEFIFEHYWGYSRQRDGSTLEYQVEHLAWRTQTVSSHRIEGDLRGIYGPAFGEVLQNEPSSVLLAEGSEVTVRKGLRLS